MKRVSYGKHKSEEQNPARGKCSLSKSVHFLFSLHKQQYVGKKERQIIIWSEKGGGGLLMAERQMTAFDFCGIRERTPF